ncbi:phosphatase PAP2 family protein [Krasilnikovia sp. MM14-A1259]|uniref:phosphatase PAP2 family protein n=1 Tax=Krasilnikovia sp. MM14-A1259 TaxID=3373539 RepID=UPI0037F5D7EC
MNYGLFEALNGFAGRVDGIDDLMEFSAVWLIYALFAVVAVLVAIAVWRRRLRPVIAVGASGVIAFATATLIGRFDTEVRPFQSHTVHQLIAHEPGSSLPSDHATAAFTLALAVGAFLYRRWGLILGVVALVIGVSRIWVGVHYPADIVAAALIAVLSVAVVNVASRGPRPRHRPDAASRTPIRAATDVTP